MFFSVTEIFFSLLSASSEANRAIDPPFSHCRVFFFFFFSGSFRIPLPHGARSLSLARFCHHSSPGEEWKFDSLLPSSTSLGRTSEEGNGPFFKKKIKERSLTPTPSRKNHLISRERPVRVILLIELCVCVRHVIRLGLVVAREGIASSYSPPHTEQLGSESIKSIPCPSIPSFSSSSSFLPSLPFCIQRHKTWA